MNNLFSRLLDRLKATHRTRQILVNIGLFITVVITFITTNPTFELSAEAIKWIAVLAFFGNALAAIVTTPYRMVPLGYDLIQEPGGLWTLKPSENTTWLGLILDALKATDQLKTILANVGIFIGLVIALFISEEIISADLPQWIAAIGFAGNAMAGIYNNPDRSIPETYDLIQLEDGTYIIEPKAVGDPVGNDPDDIHLHAARKLPNFAKIHGTVFNFD